MIVVRGRELLVPNYERYLGTTYDDSSESREIMIDRILPGGLDIADLLFKLDLEYASGDPDTVELEKEITETKVILTWEITSSQLQVPGTVLAQLRAFNSDGKVKWSSFQAYFEVLEHQNTPGSYTGDLTELEQLEAKMAAQQAAIAGISENIDEQNQVIAKAIEDLQELIAQAGGTTTEILFYYASGTLPAGETELTITDTAIKDIGKIDYYTSLPDVTYDSVSVSAGNITFTFPAQQADMQVKVRCIV